MYDNGGNYWLTASQFEDDLIKQVSNSSVNPRFNPNELWSQDKGQFVLTFAHSLENHYLERIARDYVNEPAGLHSSRILSLRVQRNTQTTNIPNNPVKPLNNQVKNRRYQRLQQLLKEGNYFRDEEIRKRNPQLYHNCFGKYFGEIPPKTDSVDPCFSSEPCLGDMLNDANIAIEHQKNNHNIEVSSSIQISGSTTSTTTTSLSFTTLSITSPNDQNLVCENALRDEMIRMATEQFLQGYDDEFVHYRETIDQNERLDLCREFNEDAEDSYFDY